MSIISEDISSIISNTDLYFLKDKDILITGASGLVGSYFAQTLQELKKKGVGPSRIFLSSKSGEFQFDVDIDTEVLVGDITDLRILNNLPKLDIIIHAAGYGQPDKFLEKPLLTLELNTSCTLQLVSKVKTGGKFLYLSSSEVYSGLISPPFAENQIGTTNTNHPRAPYIEGKRAGESIVSTIDKQKNISAKSVRLSLAYGPGTKIGDSRAINSFIHQAIAESKIELKDSGDAMRTYCYVTDAIEMCFAVMNLGIKNIYNVAGNSRISILNLATLIAEITGASLTVPQNNNLGLNGAPDDVWLDISQTVLLTNKSRFIPLSTGLKNTIDWQRYNVFRV
jgi:nucleoside-diphosphate-sugar epimerase